MTKPAFCTCANKVADQLHGTRTADKRLCFRYKDITIPQLIFQASSHSLWLYKPASVRPSRKPQIQGFSRRGSYDFDREEASFQELNYIYLHLLKNNTYILPSNFIEINYASPETGSERQQSNE